MNDTRTALFQIHAAVLLFGAIGLFGEWITLPAPLIVAGRVVVAAMALFFLLRARGQNIWLYRKRIWPLFLLSGAIMALHWIAFFQCVKMAGVAVAVLTFATAPVFAGFLEPLFFKERLRLHTVILSFVCIAGVVLLLPHLDLHSARAAGVLWGEGSALGFAALSMLYRHAVVQTPPLVVMFWQCAVATVLTTPIWFIVPFTFGWTNAALIGVLGVVFTALAHGLYVSGMKAVKAHTATVIVTLEPVYAVLLAWVLLAQRPGLATLAGGALILGAAFFAAGDSNADYRRSSSAKDGTDARTIAS